MKNKKTFIIIILSLVVFIVLGFIISNIASKPKDLKIHEIENIKKVDITLPRFTVVLLGKYDDVITEKSIKNKNIPIYEFDAALDNGWNIETNCYTGIKLTDIFDSMKIVDYTTIEFRGLGNLKIKYNINEISDKMYLVFYRDGEPLRKDQRLALISFDYDYKYAVEDLISMKFSDEKIDNNQVTKK